MAAPGSSGRPHARAPQFSIRNARASQWCGRNDPIATPGAPQADASYPLRVLPAPAFPSLPARTFRPRRPPWTVVSAYQFLPMPCLLGPAVLATAWSY